MINIRKINRLPGELFKKVSRRTASSKRRNNLGGLRRTHLASAKNCFQAPLRSLYGVNYLLMRDVLVTFMYVPLAGGNCARSQCDAASQQQRAAPARPRSLSGFWRGPEPFLTRLGCHDDACPVRGPVRLRRTGSGLRPPQLLEGLSFWRV